MVLQPFADMQTVVKGNFQSGNLVRSYAVCASWVHTTGSLLWPSSTPDVSYLPDPIVGDTLAPILPVPGFSGWSPQGRA